MNTQSLYNQLKKREISEQKFLYEVRRDPQLTMVHPTNSLTDTISILKRHKVIFEVKDKNPELPEVESLTIDQVSPFQYAKGIEYELELINLPAGNNLPEDEELKKVQQTVLKNLTSDKYYYTKKEMSDVEKKQEKEKLEPTELKKDMTAPNQMKKGKKLKENLDQYYSQEGDDECDGCSREQEELDIDVMNPNELEILSKIIDEWGLIETDMEDSDIMDELADEFQKRNQEGTVDEAIALKDKAGNVQYAKDDSEANNILNQARTKNVQLTKQAV